MKSSSPHSSFLHQPINEVCRGVSGLPHIGHHVGPGDGDQVPIVHQDHQAARLTNQQSCERQDAVHHMACNMCKILVFPEQITKQCKSENKEITQYKKATIILPLKAEFQQEQIRQHHLSLLFQDHCHCRSALRPQIVA